MNISSKINKFNINISFKQTLVLFKTMIQPELSKDKSMVSAAGYHAKTNWFSVIETESFKICLNQISTIRCWIFRSGNRSKLPADTVLLCSL